MGMAKLQFGLYSGTFGSGEERSLGRSRGEYLLAPTASAITSGINTSHCKHANKNKWEMVMVIVNQCAEVSWKLHSSIKIVNTGRSDVYHHEDLLLVNIFRMHMSQVDWFNSETGSVVYEAVSWIKVLLVIFSAISVTCQPASQPTTCKPGKCQQIVYLYNDT